MLYLLSHDLNVRPSMLQQCMGQKLPSSVVAHVKHCASRCATPETPISTSIRAQSHSRAIPARESWYFPVLPCAHEINPPRQDINHTHLRKHTMRAEECWKCGWRTEVQKVKMREVTEKSRSTTKMATFNATLTMQVLCSQDACSDSDFPRADNGWRQRRADNKALFFLCSTWTTSSP